MTVSVASKRWTKQMDCVIQTDELWLFSGSNPCAHHNGGCRFLCLPTSRGGRTCTCPDDIDPEECNRISLL